MPEGATSKVWYVVSSQGREGPFTLDDVLEKIKNGALKATDLAWCAGMVNWEKVEEVEALKKTPQAPEHRDDVTEMFSRKSISLQTSTPSLELASDSQATEDPLTRRFKTSEIESAEKVELDVQNCHEHTYSSINTALKESFDKVKNERRSTDRRRNDRGTSDRRGPKPQMQFGVPAASAMKATPVGAIPLGRKPERKIKKLLSWSRPLILAVAISILSYAFFIRFNVDSLLPAGFVSYKFSEISELNAEQNAALKAAVMTPVREGGQKFEVIYKGLPGGDQAFYVGTNLEDGVRFSLTVKGVAETLVGENASSSPFTMVVKDHIARAIFEKAAPGYYLATLNFFGSPKHLWADRIFLGGSPDLNYRTKLNDFNAVRRGMARAELSRVKDLRAGVEKIVVADQRAAASLQDLRTQKGRAQAWQIYDPNWRALYHDIDVSSEKPSRFFNVSLEKLRSMRQRLISLHEKNQALAAIVPTKNEKQLSKNSIATAELLAEEQLIANDVLSQLKEIGAALDIAEKHLSDPTAPISEEQTSP